MEYIINEIINDLESESVNQIFILKEKYNIDIKDVAETSNSIYRKKKELLEYFNIMKQNFKVN
ncbi:hypothetical protein HGM08_001670 [Campylobacter jejuni]|nr:hypothetical protein [Campylobacter jejuni]EFB5611712.1 hypothetical protein [Campylobacter jejuni]